MFNELLPRTIFLSRLHLILFKQPFEFKKLIKLNLSKNEKGEYQCPVMFRTFTNQSHIVAIANTGNVFSYDVSGFSFIFSGIKFILNSFES